MIGVDTNVLLRLSDKTDPSQSARARAFVASQGDGGCFVNEIVLAEYAWTLKRSYKLPREEIVDRVEALLNSREFVVARTDEVRRALDLYDAGPADFVDYFLSEINRSQGCFGTASFDLDALKSGDPFLPVPA
jgi:predicted nucleic-acid-binding protein